MYLTVLRMPFGAAVSAGTVAGLLLIASLGRTQAPPPPPMSAEAPAEELGVETLTQGPIHEAFANPTDMDPTPGPTVAMQPPEPVAEEPPEYMPEGAQWIPGYWVWDDERDAFIWVTGVARIPPPNMQWVPGYFAEAEGGWQRVSGFWTSVEEPEVEYRAAGPPETLEAGPSSPAPSEQHFWIPGNWAHYDTGYRWQAGYWSPYQENWIWVPARWVWTPGGFVFCPGFWDYRLAYRGQMFAPVYFQQPIYTRPAYVYRPWCVIPTNNLFIHLWIRPRWNCYYFGNYYGSQFAQRGFVPWANVAVVSRQRYMYDPFHSYARVHYHRQGIDYIGRVQGWHTYYSRHEDLRPPRTWHQQQQFFARGGSVTRVETQLVARTVVDVARREDNAVRMVRLDEQTFRDQRQHADRLREFNQQRKQLEVSHRPTARGPDGDRRGDGRDAPGRNEGKTNALDRVEGKAGRDNATAGAPPRLAIPRDLATSNRGVGRGPGNNDRPGEGSRGGDGKGGKAGNVAGRQPGGPPPRPRPTSTTVRADGDQGSKAGKSPGIDRQPDTDRQPGADRQPNADRQPKGVAKGAERETPTPNVDARDRGKGKVIDREELPGRGKTAERPMLPGKAREPEGGVIAPDRGAAGQGRGRTDNADRPGVPKGKAGEANAPGTRERRNSTIDDTPRRPEGTRGGLPGLNPGAAGRDAEGGARGGKSLGPRPDAGIGRPEGTITPPFINPDRPGAPGTAAPGANRGPAGNRNAPGIDRGNANPARSNPGARTSPFAPPSSGGAPRPDSPRANPAENRGKGNPNRGGEGKSDRTETMRPTFNREPSPAVIPRVQAQPEARSLPRSETTRESRPAPRAESPRVEATRPTPRNESSRVGPSSDRGQRSVSSSRSEATSPSGNNERTGGKSKGRDRDN